MVTKKQQLVEMIGKYGIEFSNWNEIIAFIDEHVRFEEDKPKWRPATVDDVGKPCRYRDSNWDEWVESSRLIYVFDQAAYGFVCVIEGSETLPAGSYKFCEVQE